jgi:hypothetical protein
MSKNSYDFDFTEVESNRRRSDFVFRCSVNRTFPYDIAEYIKSYLQPARYPQKRLKAGPEDDAWRYGECTICNKPVNYYDGHDYCKPCRRFGRILDFHLLEERLFSKFWDLSIAYKESNQDQRQHIRGYIGNRYNPDHAKKLIELLMYFSLVREGYITDVTKTDLEKHAEKVQLLVFGPSKWSVDRSRWGFIYPTSS